MDFLRRIFGGGSTPGDTPRSPGDANGLYYYVRPHGCDEVVRVRIDRANDLSQMDEGDGYFVRKHVRGVKCRQGVDMEMTYDASRTLKNSSLQGGALVSQDEYESWVASQPSAG